jgi:hypothetical protein
MTYLRDVLAKRRCQITGKIDFSNSSGIAAKIVMLVNSRHCFPVFAERGIGENTALIRL